MQVYLLVVHVAQLRVVVGIFMLSGVPLTHARVPSCYDCCRCLIAISWPYCVMNCLSPLFLLSLPNDTNCFADHGYSSRLLFLLSVFCLHAHWVLASCCCRIRLSPFCFTCGSVLWFHCVVLGCFCVFLDTDICDWPIAVSLHCSPLSA